MARFAANVGFLYAELPYVERLGAARADGFEAVESAWPAIGAEAFAAAARAAGLRVALLNVDAGDLAAGERGHANDPAATGRWRRDVIAALDLAEAVACPVLNVLAGNAVATVPPDEQRACFRDNVAWALPVAAARRRRLVVELLNRAENPTYLVTSLADVAAIVEPLVPAGLGLQLDTYHLGVAGTDVVAAFEATAAFVGHVQIADVPGRHEPGTGTIDWPGFFDALDRAGYEGAVGLEYHPRGGTTEGLAWLPPERRRWVDGRWSPG